MHHYDVEGIGAAGFVFLCALMTVNILAFWKVCDIAVWIYRHLEVTIK